MNSMSELKSIEKELEKSILLIKKDLRDIKKSIHTVDLKIDLMQKNRKNPKTFKETFEWM